MIAEFVVAGCMVPGFMDAGCLDAGCIKICGSWTPRLQKCCRFYIFDSIQKPNVFDDPVEVVV